MNDTNIDDFIERQAWTDGRYAIAYAMLAMAEALQSTSAALENLGSVDSTFAVEIVK